MGWWREREAAIAAGQPDPYEGLDDREWQWLEAMKPKIVEGKPKFDRPETEAVAERMLQLAELQKKVSSKPIGRKMCSVRPLGPKSMEAVLEVCPLS